MSKPFYLTTPLYYVNAPPHLGGTYTTLVCDTIARYKRMMGFDVRLFSGTDEHGQKIERSARNQNITPKALADRVYGQYADLWKDLGISLDSFVRTTEPRHHAAVQELYRRAKAAGAIYKGSYSGWYCVSCEAYAPESDPSTPVPCPDCGRQTEWFSEESYFFKLSAFQQKLLDLYEQRPEFIRPATRLNEIRSFVAGGLKDLSISRATLKWGIPLPDDPAHVFYVWFDALTGYLTGAGFQSDNAVHEKYWPCDLHLVGKDILRFHTVYWPAFLMAAGVPLPKTVFGHGWWLFKDEKMSKSRGNVFDPRVLTGVFGTEVLRYFLLREMVFGQDCNFSIDSIVQRANSDLANDLGNLLSRTLAMIGKYRNGVVPNPGQATGDADVEAVANETIREFRGRFDEYDFSSGLESVWRLIARVNKYIVENEPWVLAEQPDKARQLDSVLFHSAEALRVIAIALSPVMPNSAQVLWGQLGFAGRVDGESLVALSWSQSACGRTVKAGTALFPRIDKKEIAKKMEDSEVPAPAPAPVPAPAAEAAPSVEGTAGPWLPLASAITIDDFARIDLRVGTVLEAEAVKGADRLLRILVDLGFERRQVVAGIAKAYAPESLIGRKVVIVANLQPRKLRGLESNGMIVAASIGPDDKPVLAGFHEDIPNGARLK